MESVTGVQSKDPRVTFVLSVFNDAEHISKALFSILAQDYSNFDVVVVDDGSTDETKDILLKIASSNERVSLIRQSNHGLTKSLNTGILRASGDFIARLDSDDICFPDRLRKQVAVIKQDENISVVAARAEIYVGGEYKHTTQFFSSGQISRRLRYVNCIQHSSVLIRKKTLIDYGLYDSDLSTSQDFDLWIRFIRAGYRVVMCDEPLIRRNIRLESVSRKKLYLQSKNSFRIRAKHRTVSTTLNSILFGHQLFRGWVSNVLEGH